MDIYTELDNFIEENEGQVTLTDVAKHFTDYGCNYTVDKTCEWLDSYFEDGYDLCDDYRKAMEI
ncbi:hypothetical protein [Lachnospira sp.]|uniref:hypothetical protein n=1 Tax=Lachnospira sp. TaxID=2049031 RepID=UPI00257A9184|nr:hypothetical protein [Lachnospira sp.]